LAFENQLTEFLLLLLLLLLLVTTTACCRCPVQVNAVEERLGHATTVSVDRERLGEEIDEQQTLAADIDNRRPRVQALTDTCRPHDRPAVDELTDR